ncbi:MAG: TULIP family P47-like protein [Roseibium sp.]|uniref:TULIP family P47-like protein n=1 Tax=Roseibium sp. TaxID=1936156 RepID=UPI002635A86D|nr:TULIP family P47-like protein [Roseibium sp.]MCV0427017.1 TULIP family P47-like protein [Roseibium sp.]
MTGTAATHSSYYRTFVPPKAFRPKVFVPREELPAAYLGKEATTYGWDSVNCIQISTVNQSIKTSGQYPKNLKIVVNPNSTWDIDVSFDAWQIAEGGSGAIVFMKLPLTKATMTYPALAAARGTAGNKFDFTGGYALVSIKLRYVPQKQNPFFFKGGERETIDELIADAQARSPDDPPVLVQKVNYGSLKPTKEESALFEAALTYLLTNNLDKFEYVFSVVNLNQRAAKEQFQWLKPTYTSYAYFQGLSEDSSYFAVLNQLDGNSPDGLTNQVSASAIPSGSNASILISNRLFLERMVLPGLVQAFPDAPSNAFKIPKTGDIIEITESLDLDSVEVGGINYHPKMTYFRLQVVGDEVQINTKVHIPISPGIDAYVNSTYYYAIGLVEKKDGSYTMDFEPSEEPNITSWHEIASWVTWTEITVALIGAVVGAVVGEAIETVARKILVIVIITVVAGVLAVIPSIIADVAANGAAEALPPIGPMIDEAQAPVNWPDSSGFQLQTAELNGSLQFGGLLKP